jgi:hypothetical protein
MGGGQSSGSGGSLEPKLNEIERQLQNISVALERMGTGINRLNYIE